MRDLRARLVTALGRVHRAAWVVTAATIGFIALFGTLAVRNQQSYGTWSYDMGIYDQGFWLVSRGGRTFMTVRGLDFWGHHLNLIAFAFAPFYWLGAGPSFLYLVQAICLGLGAMPVYLIARDRFSSPWMGCLFATCYLVYAPVEWLSWAMFHPEALIVLPFLWAWRFATTQRWPWYGAMLLTCLVMREDVALAVLVLGLVVAIVHRRDPDRRRIRWIAAGTSALGLVWYLVATKVVIPHFDHGLAPFYMKDFYGDYGGTLPSVVRTVLLHPNRVISDATQPDRLRFYRDLILPYGGLPMLGVVPLLAAGPQMLASIIGSSPYARMIHYQYVSVLVAPITIAAIEGAWLIWRFRIVRRVLPWWLLMSAYVTNIAWSPSPIGSGYGESWSGPSARTASMDRAIALVPSAASVSATYHLLPHLSHREHVYDWPNPFEPQVWGNDGCDHLPDPTTVQYVVLDRQDVGDDQVPLVDAMLAPGGTFRTLFDENDVVVAERVGTDPIVDQEPQQEACGGVAP